MNIDYNNIFISVIMPVYNGAEWMEETIDSILNQTHSNFEFIIVNDCSTDNSQKILDKYAGKDNRIKLFKTPKNCGNPGGSAALAVNKCSNKSKYIIPTDQDDISVKDRIESQIKFMETNPNVDISGGWVKTFGSKHRYSKSPTDDKIIKVRLFTGCAMAHPTTIFKKSFFDQNNINYDNELCQDYKLWVKCAFEHNATFANIQKILLYYRVHENQTSNSNAALKKESNKVREYQLKKLGFTNKDDINNFILWRKKQIKPTKENLAKRKELLKQAILFNESKNIYPQPEFKQRLKYLYKKDLLKGKRFGLLLKVITKGL